MQSTRARVAFTLVELLVVIGIIAVLVGLLTVAVNKIREQNDSNTCKNNLRQMALGFEAHHDAKEAWPSGGCAWQESANRTFISNGVVMNGVNPNAVPADYNYQAMGWMYQLLPYIGQNDVWLISDYTQLGQTAVALYRCPLVRTTQVFTYSQTGAATLRAMNTYVANGGQWVHPDDWTPGGSSLDGPLQPTLKCTTMYVDRETGRSPARLAGRKSNVTDGLSNTLMLGEKFFNPNASTGGTCNDDQGWLDGWDNDTIGSARGYSQGNPIYPPRDIATAFGTTMNGWTTCDTSFGSLHREGMHAAFCDGSVHNIAFDIDPNTWMYLLVANDGKTTFNRLGID